VSGQKWRLEAACRAADPETAFTDEVGFIKAWCRHCPVKRACLDFALQHDDIGAYGGMTRRLRRMEKKRREMGQQVKACGSDTAYHRHRRNGEDACGPCRRAHSRVTTAQHRAKRAVA
jgi:hypothetical protein